MWTKRHSLYGDESCKFFRSWLITASPADVEIKSQNYHKELDMFHKGMLKLSWYMRGGVSISEIHDMPAEHIGHLNSIIDDNFEMSKKAGTPIL